jgi:hypothetical protein
LIRFSYALLLNEGSAKHPSRLISLIGQYKAIGLARANPSKISNHQRCLSRRINSGAVDGYVSGGRRDVSRHRHHRLSEEWRDVGKGRSDGQPLLNADDAAYDRRHDEMSLDEIKRNVI